MPFTCFCVIFSRTHPKGRNANNVVVVLSSQANYRSVSPAASVMNYEDRHGEDGNTRIVRSSDKVGSITSTTSTLIITSIYSQENLCHVHQAQTCQIYTKLPMRPQNLSGLHKIYNLLLCTHTGYFWGNHGLINPASSEELLQNVVLVKTDDCNRFSPHSQMPANLQYININKREKNDEDGEQCNDYWR